MNLVISLINSLLNFFLKLFQIKAVHPVVWVGRFIFLAGMTGGFALSISASYQGVPIEVEFSQGSGMLLSLVCVCIGILTMLGGSLMTLESFRSSVIYVKGLPTVPQSFPVKVIGKPYIFHHPHVTTISINDSSPEDTISDVNGNCRVLISQVLDVIAYPKVFVAGLARVPCLFAIGSMFRGASANIEVMDRFRSNGWRKLTDIPTIAAPEVMRIGDVEDFAHIDQVGLCVSFTSRIMKEELPDIVKDNYIEYVLKPSPKPEAFEYKQHIDKFVLEYKCLLDQLFKTASVVHLFISAQSSIVFEMGRVYQEGMHGTVIIYNYDPTLKKYPWAIKAQNGALSLVTT